MRERKMHAYTREPRRASERDGGREGRLGISKLREGGRAREGRRERPQRLGLERLKEGGRGGGSER